MIVKWKGTKSQKRNHRCLDFDIQPPLSPRLRLAPECHLVYPVNDKWACSALSLWLECRTAEAKIILMQSYQACLLTVLVVWKVWPAYGCKAHTEVRNWPYCCHLFSESKGNGWKKFKKSPSGWEAGFWDGGQHNQSYNCIKLLTEIVDFLNEGHG